LRFRVFEEVKVSGMFREPLIVVCIAGVEFLQEAFRCVRGGPQVRAWALKLAPLICGYERVPPPTQTDVADRVTSAFLGVRFNSTATLYSLMCSQRRRYTNRTSRYKDVKEAVESRGCKGRSLRTSSRSYPVFR
jgi:hypothetical protein